MSSEIAIKVENLSKCYRIYDKPRDRLIQMLSRGGKQYYHEFWALNDVSFEVKKGETVGIVGRNGSGKSTLLQLIYGTLSPTSGSVTTNGRVAALLELGSGFNPEFTGKENIYVNASVLGLSNEEIDSRYDDIVQFADIGDVIEQPVKTYSSGMLVRLAFAVQAQVSPDIFIVDEALAVGDAKFQAKCFDRLKRLKENGTSILLVTHASEQIVTHCTSALLLEKGKIFESGQPRFVVNRYMDLLFGKARKTTDEADISSNSTIPAPSMAVDSELSRSDDVFASRNSYNPYEYRWGDGRAIILDFFLAANDEAYPTALRPGQSITLAVSIKFVCSLIRPILGITIKTKEGVTVYSVNSETLEVTDFQSLGQTGQIVTAVARFSCRLAPGDYFVSLGIATKNGDDIIPHDRRYDAIHLYVQPVTTFSGLIDLDLKLNAKAFS